MREFRSINSEFAKLETSENVPKPDDYKKTVDYFHLLYLQETGQETYIFEKTKDIYRIVDLLEGVYTEANLNLKQIKELSNDIIKANQDWESIKLVLMEMKINPAYISEGKLVQTTFVKTIQHLSQQRRVREFLLMLKRNGLVFAERWFPVLNRDA